jgi:hypothetical protein
MQNAITNHAEGAANEEGAGCCTKTAAQATGDTPSARIDTLPLDIDILAKAMTFGDEKTALSPLDSIRSKRRTLVSRAAAAHIHACRHGCCWS